MRLKQLGKTLLGFFCITACDNVHFAEEPEVRCEHPDSPGGCFQVPLENGECPEGMIKVRRHKAIYQSCPIEL